MGRGCWGGLKEWWTMSHYLENQDKIGENQMCWWDDRCRLTHWVLEHPGTKKNKYAVVIINTLCFKWSRQQTMVVIFLLQRDHINSGRLRSLHWYQKYFEILSSLNFQILKIKIMKFSVASIVTLIALFSQTLAVSIQYCMSYCHPLKIYRSNWQHIFSGAGPDVHPW